MSLLINLSVNIRLFQYLNKILHLLVCKFYFFDKL